MESHQRIAQRPQGQRRSKGRKILAFKRFDAEAATLYLTGVILHTEPHVCELGDRISIIIATGE